MKLIVFFLSAYSTGVLIHFMAAILFEDGLLSCKSNDLTNNLSINAE